MARVRSQDTLPERTLRRLLWRGGVRYRLHRRDLPGKPDVYVGRLRLAIFVNGCFWHGHDCKRGQRPATNVGFWAAKIERNRERDARVISELAESGIESLVLWTCRPEEFDRIARRVSIAYKKMRS